jgi:hypothetical protein
MGRGDIIEIAQGSRIVDQDRVMDREIGIVKDLEEEMEAKCDETEMLLPMMIHST